MLADDISDSTLDTRIRFGPCIFFMVFSRYQVETSPSVQSFEAKNSALAVSSVQHIRVYVLVLKYKYREDSEFTTAACARWLQ